MKQEEKYEKLNKLNQEIRSQKNYEVIRNLRVVEGAIRKDRKILTLPEKNILVLSETVGKLMSLEITHKIKINCMNGRLEL